MGLEVADIAAQAGLPAARAGDGRLLADVSNRIVGLHKQYYGRGPSKARTFYRGDLLVCLLEGGFTPVEKTLAERGRGQAVIEQRSEFQDAVQQEFKDAVAELTGRRVKAFMSGAHQAPDMICEVFVLDEASTDDAPQDAESPV